MISVITVPEARTGPSKALHITLWIGQVFLALFFGLAGVMKSTMPLAELAKSIPWVPEVPGWLVRFIGGSELAGALGLLLPSLTRIRPVLTPVAGAGLATIMVLATGFHLSRGELPYAVQAVVLAGIAGLLAWGRFRKAPITARS